MIDLEELAERMVRTVRNGATNEEIRQEFMRSAKLLRDQEPVPPKFDAFSALCGNCGGVLDVAEPDPYCPFCGRKVKWE